MKKKNLIIVVASCIMLLAYFALPCISGIRIPELDPSRTESTAHSLFDMLTDKAPTMAFLIFLLLLLAPLYLLLDAYLEKFIKKVILPRKIVFLLPLILIVCLRVLMNSFMSTGNDLPRVGVFGIGFYLYLAAAVVVAVLPWVKNPRT